MVGVREERGAVIDGQIVGSLGDVVTSRGCLVWSVESKARFEVMLTSIIPNDLHFVWLGENWDFNASHGHGQVRSILREEYWPTILQEETDIPVRAVGEPQLNIDRVAG